MNTSFWSHCQGLVRRLQKRRSARPRERQRLWCMAETLEDRILLSSTPALVADIIPGSGSSNPANLAVIGSTTYFTAYDSIHGQELWKSDGTAEGTMMVKDVKLGGESSQIGNLTAVNGTLYFSTSTSTDDGFYGVELWKSDGTAAGTMMVKAIWGRLTLTSVNGLSLTSVNGTLYFSANEGFSGYELWKSDGTTEGTVMVKDIFPGIFSVGGGDAYGGGSADFPNSSSPTNLTNFNGTLFFTADDAYGRKLWTSDGTDAGTVPVVSSVFVTGQLTNVSGTLYFNGDDGITGGELWKSDGTAAGTTLVKDILPGGINTFRYSSNPTSLTNVNGTLFFTATDGVHGQELWKSDCTASGTNLVKDIFPGGFTGGGGGHYLNSSSAFNLANVSGTLLFTSTDGVHGQELWKSDGTAAGTAMVKDIWPGSQGSSTSNLTYVDGTLYFSANDGMNGYELWKSNGTATGTVRVTDIFPGPNSSNPGNLTNANGALFFTANDGVHGIELWVLNTAAPPIAATSLGVSGFPAIVTAGSPGSFTVTAKNADGTTSTGYLGKVHFTSTDPQAVLPADYTFTAADHGMHTFSANLKTAGTRSITVADSTRSDLTGTQGGITVNAGAASQFVISAPSSVNSGVAFSLTLSVKDAYGNVVIGYTGTVRFTSTDSSAALPGNYTFTAADKGVHTFAGLVLRKKGKQKITITDTLNNSLTASAVESVK